MRFIAKIENCPYGSRFSNGNTYCGFMKCYNWFFRKVPACCEKLDYPKAAYR